MKNFFNSLKLFISKIFGSVFALFIKDAEAIVKIVQKIKWAVENPAADTIALFIPGEVDDFVLKIVRNSIDDVLYIMGRIYEFTEDGDRDNLLLKFIEFARSKNKNARIDLWSRFAAEFIVAWTDKKISLAEGYTLTQLAYEALFKKKIALS